MNNTILKNLLYEYEQIRLKASKDLELRKKNLYSKIPELFDLENQISSLAITASKSLISENNKKILDNLQRDIENLKAKRNDILKKNNIPEDYLYLNFLCDKCKDTGYITSDNNTIMCNCLKQKIFDIEYNKSNISNLKNQNFSNFISTVYSECVDKQKYNSDISPRKNIELIKNICIDFINNFDDPNEKNLLFTGNTGLGKTFLSSCIANELLLNGKTVLYQTAPVMLDAIIDYRFGKETASNTIYNNLLDVDLLIIDDLGTECMNNMKFTELFNIINTRLLNQNNKPTKTIISTNLSLQNLFKTYDERIVSRIVGNYNICRFFGDDIRFIKR